MAAIEQGIITETTKGRLLELEADRSSIEAKIAIAKSDIVEISRDDLIAGLEMYRDGDICNKKYQARLFDTFLVAVYVYDDELKIVFSFSGKKNTVRIPMDASAVDNIENSAQAECSFKLPSGPPRRSKLCIACSDLFYKSERAHAAAPPFQLRPAIAGLAVGVPPCGRPVLFLTEISIEAFFLGFAPVSRSTLRY